MVVVVTLPASAGVPRPSSAMVAGNDAPPNTDVALAPAHDEVPERLGEECEEEEKEVFILSCRDRPNLETTSPLSILSASSSSVSSGRRRLLVPSSHCCSRLR